MKAKFQRFVMAWRVKVPASSLQMAEVDQLILAIDYSYPNSQPRIFAPAAGSSYSWPHVEQNGLLCLRSTRCTAPTAERIATHLNDAEDLLNYSETKRQKEFEREFVNYWAHRATNTAERAPRVLSLVAPGGVAREVCYYYDAKTDRYVVGDEKAALIKWLRNTGEKPSDRDISSTWLFRLSHPWKPKDFPEYGRDITQMLSSELVHRYIVPGARLPFLFEAKTLTGASFAAVVLHGAKQRDLLKGYRNISRVPPELIINSYKSRALERCTVSRVDGGWIHGRDHPSSYAEVKNRKVAIIGCGAIGSSVARLLAQAGVGEIMLVDGDCLTTANVSRHLLGIEHVGFNKAFILQIELRKQFPHLTFDHAFKLHFEHLSVKNLEQLARADLIISAGIDFDGEAALDTWRRTLPQPPTYLSTWVEAYAAAGHAVLLYGGRSILPGFDEDERPSFRLTDWPDEAGALIIEAGCGNSFQPHGIVDLHPTIGLAAGLALDSLLDKVPVSCRRVWMGNPQVVERNGGILRTNFTDTFIIREFPWP